MNPRAITLLRIVLALVVGANSLALVVAQLSGRPHHALLALGAAELIAAFLFLLPPTVRLGGLSLLVIFALAAVFHFLHGEYGVAYLAVYAAATYAVVSHRRTT